MPNLVIANTTISQDENGLYNLNDLYRASEASDNPSKRPNQGVRNAPAQELIKALIDQTALEQSGVIISRNGGLNPGIYAHELIAISYAGWISPRFQLIVNQAFIDSRLAPQLTPPKSDLMQANDIVLEHLTLAATFSTPRHVALTHGAQEAMRKLPVDLTPYLLHSADMQDIPDNEVFLEPTELGVHLGISRNKINPYLVSLGLQQKLSGGIWQPTQEAIDAGMCIRHPWANKGKSGYNWKWNLEAVKQRIGD